MTEVDIRPFNEWLTDDDGDAWLVEGLVHYASTGWFAHRCIGKSLLTVDLAVALARGETEWLGRRIKPGTGKVVFLVSDPKAVKETSRRLGNMGAPDNSVEVARIRRGQDVSEWTTLAERLKGARLVIVDSGTNLVFGINEPEFTGPFFDGLNELVDADIPVLLVHHMPKTGKTAAGNYQWESWPRWLVHIEKDGENYRTLRLDGNETTDLPMTLVVRMPRKDHPSSRFSLADARAGKEARSPERMTAHDKLFLRMTDRGEWRSQQHIADELDTSQKTVSRVLAENHCALVNGKILSQSDPPLYIPPD